MRNTTTTKCYGVEVWHGTTQVYVDFFSNIESAEAYRQECLNDHERRAYGWNRYVSGVIEFENESEFDKYKLENEGSY